MLRCKLLSLSYWVSCKQRAAANRRAAPLSRGPTWTALYRLEQELNLRPVRPCVCGATATYCSATELSSLAQILAAFRTL